jgi:hypothetical protein
MADTIYIIDQILARVRELLKATPTFADATRDHLDNIVLAELEATLHYEVDALIEAAYVEAREEAFGRSHRRLRLKKRNHAATTWTTVFPFS